MAKGDGSDKASPKLAALEKAAVGTAGVLGKMSGVVGAVVGALKAVPAALADALATVSGFVKAFNPGAIEAMDAAFESLYSTVGFALEPVIQGVTQALRDFANEIGDVFTELRPAVEEISGAMLTVLNPLIHAAGTALRGWMGVLDAAMPSVRAMMRVFEGVAAVVTVANEIYTSLLTSALESFGEGLFGIKSVSDVVVDALAALAVGLVKVTVWALRLTGGGAVAAKILDAILRPDGNGARPGAPKDFALSSTDDIYRKRLLAASQAQQGGALTKSESLLDQIRGELVGLRDDLKANPGGGNAWMDWARNQINRWGFRQEAQGGV